MKRSTLATGLVAAAITASFAGGMAAQAAGFPVFSTTSKVERLVSPTCYSVDQTTVTDYHWSSKAGRYVLYSGSPHTTVTHNITCHAAAVTTAVTTALVRSTDCPATQPVYSLNYALVGSWHVILHRGQSVMLPDGDTLTCTVAGLSVH